MLFDQYTGRTPEQTNTYNFYGLNRTRRGSKGEFSDMKNMGTLEYPCAAPRGARKMIVYHPYAIDAAAAPDSTNVSSIAGLTGISDGKFYYNGDVKSDDYLLASDYQWEIVRCSNIYIINGFKSVGGYSSMMFTYNIDTDTFAPGDNDKIMRDLILTAGVDENGSYLATYRYAYDSVYNYTATSDDGTVIKNADFFDEYGYPTLPSENIFSKVFSVGEEVSISGFPSRSENFGQVWNYIQSSGTVLAQTNKDYSGNNTVDTDLYPTMDGIDKWAIVLAYVKSFDTDTYNVGTTTAYIHKIYFDLYNKNSEPIDFLDMSLDTGDIHCSGITISRRGRIFDHIGMHLDRLWGTSPTGNRIYISSSSDLFDFTPASVNSVDAGRLEFGTPGTFVGMAEFESEMVLFKEDSISVVYGNNISSLSVSTIPEIGCIDPKSIVVTPKGIVFLSYTGFYIFSGSTPTLLSYKLNTKYSSAACGFDGNILWAAAVDSGEQHELLCYDFRHATWHVHDDLAAISFFRFRGKFYIVTSRMIFEADADYDEEFEWSFTSTLIHDNTLNDKAVNEIWIRADVPENGEFTVHTAVDGGKKVEHVRFSNPVGLNIYRCPIRAVMGSSYKWTITGHGNVVFYEIEVHRSEGGRQRKDRDTTDQVIAKKHGRLATY